jgi:hypothetical protein
MSARGPLQRSHSRDEALAAIAEALRLVGQPDEKRAQFDELEKVRNEAHDFSDARSVKPVENARRNRLVSPSLAGLLALTCIGVAVLARQSSHGQVSPDPVSTSSVSIKKSEEMPARPAPHDSDLAVKTNSAAAEPRAEAPLQRAPTPPMVPELAQQIQTIARELANVEQGIDQLKTEQSQMVRDTAELTEHLKATEEIARHNADLTEDLKATQAQMARDNGNLADQLKASQDLMTGIAEQLRQSQEQVARLVASEQKPRPRTPASSPQTVANSTRRPVPTPPQPLVGVRTQDSGHLQPKQQ